MTAQGGVAAADELDRRAGLSGGNKPLPYQPLAIAHRHIPFKITLFDLPRRETGGAVTKVVVTGGGGFLGSRLARQLLAAGSIEMAGGGPRPLSRLTLIDRVPVPADLAADERVATLGGDLAELLDSAQANPDPPARPHVVFHLA